MNMPFKPTFLLIAMLFSPFSIAQENQTAEKISAFQLPGLEFLTSGVNDNAMIGYEANRLTGVTNKISEQGLGLQHRMADSTAEISESTLNLFYIGLAQAVISTFGAILLLFTLWHTRLSTKAAVDSALAAQQAVKQNRPYMIIDADSISISSDSSGEGNISAFFTNYGKTPSINVVAVFAAVEGRENENGVASFPDEHPINESLLQKIDGVSSTVGSGQKAPAKPFNGLFRVCAGKTRSNQAFYPVSIQAICLYEDVQGQKYKTEFVITIAITKGSDSEKLIFLPVKTSINSII